MNRRRRRRRSWWRRQWLYYLRQLLFTVSVIVKRHPWSWLSCWSPRVSSIFYSTAHPIQKDAGTSSLSIQVNLTWKLSTTPHLLPSHHASLLRICASQELRQPSAIPSYKRHPRKSINVINRLFKDLRETGLISFTSKKKHIILD